MKKTVARGSKIAISCLALVLLCLLAVTLYNVWHRQELSDLRDEALTRLERDAGEYDEQSIVLQNTSRARAEKLAEHLGATLRITSNGKYATLTLPEGTTILDVYRDPDNLAYLPELSTDYKASISDIGETTEPSLRLPSRPDYAVSDAYYAYQGYLDYLNMKNAWNQYSGFGVTVAVIDTGIDTDHPEFAGRISEYSYNATEDKIVKDYLLPGGGYDWSLIEDEQGHGTAVTGVIAAGMNSDGIVGIAPYVTIITIKAECDENGVFKRTSDLVFGLYYAIERDVAVVNMSFGGPSNEFADATQLAVDSDIICVAAAGNDRSAELQYPAADPNVFGVGALEEDGWTLADYSNYGENVNLVAPGTTYTTLMDGKYGTMNGTSLAAPVVTGAIALYLSVNPYQEFRTVEEVLYASCYDLGDLGCDYYYGYGALDVSAFLLEERGKVTFDMLTDELENTEQLFIRNHTLQNMPEPERPYAIFDGWYYDPHCLEEYNLYVDRFSTDLTLYAKWVNEDDGIPFTYVELGDGTVEIRSYTGHRRYITIPDMIDGKIVSSIGEEAFMGENRLREVILPKHLVRIRRSAFEDCNNLVHIDIPDSVIEIGERAFSGNVRLSYVGIGGNSRLQSIGMFAFSSCAKLQRFELPATVKSVDGSAFFGATNLTAFTVRSGNKDFMAKDGVLFDATQSTLVAYPAGLRGEYSLPSTVRIIGNYAFGCASFDGISLDNVQVIGDSAFVGSQLESIVIPDTVIEMGEAAFSMNSYLRSVQLGNGLTVISKMAFYLCGGVETVETPASIREIQESAFEGAFNMTSVKFASDSKLTTIGPGAFAYSGLESVEIPASVVTIDALAFATNERLLGVVFAENSNLRTIGGSAFEKTVNLKAVDLPAQLETVGAFAFKESGLEKVTIPASLTSFGAGAFAECHSLTDIAVEEANTVYTDVDGVVYDKDKTTLIEYPAGNLRSDYAILDTVTAIEEDAFYGSWNLYTVYLPESLQEIRREAFYDCQRLGFMQIPDNVVQISNYAFAECRNLRDFLFNDTSKLPRISFGTFAYCGLASFTVPASVSTIAQGAFSGCADLRSFTFAANSKLESISAYMFSGCDNLYSITFEEGSALTSVQAHGFEGMANLSSIDFGDAKLENIDNFAFRFCESLTSIDIPESVTEIGRYAFYYCTSLSEIRIPASVEFIGRFAFLGTKELSVYFASELPPAYLQEDWDHGIAGYYLGVTDVITDGDWEYAKLTSGDVAILQYLGTETDIDLTSLDFGGDIVNIGGKAFSYSTIESIVLPETLVTIQDEAFYHSALRSVSIPASVQFIGRLAFADTPIETLAFAGDAKLRVLEQSAFEGTKSLASVTLPKSLTIIGRAIFKNSGIASLTFEEGIGITEISEEAFAYTNITAVTIPDGVTLLNHSAFRETKRLKSVDFGNAEDVMIMSNVFYHSGLESVHIPANVTYIGEYAFIALTNLQGFTVAEDHLYYRAIDGLLVTKDGRKLIAAPAGREGVMTVPAGIEVIGFGAFEESKLTRISFLPDANILSFGYRAFYGSAITEMHIPASVVAIDYYAFATCKNLTKVTFAEDNQLRGVYEGAFYACSNLHDITLPDTVVEISDFAFYGCRKIDRLPISENSTLKGIYDYAFAYVGLDGDFTTPETLIDIGAHAFMGNRFTSITIPDANAYTLNIGIGAFEACNNLQEITLPFIGASFEDLGYTWFGYIFGAGGYETNSIYVPENLKKIILSEGISYAAPGALANLPHVEEIDLPDSLTYFGGGCFVGTSARHTLKNGLSLSKDDSNINIGSGYYGHLSISGDIESFGGLSGFENLTGITLPDTVTEIRANAFSGCTSLTSIMLPEGVTSIGKNAFSGCVSLTEIVLPPNLTGISDGLFNACSELTTIELPEGITEIGYLAFSGCTNLTNITLPKTLTRIGASSFRYCSSLSTLVIPEGITEIGDFTFSSCTNLTNITLPKTLTRIGDSSFNYCSSLSTLVIPEGVTDIENYAFSHCQKIETIIIPSSVKTIGENAFAGCVAIENVHINDITNWCAIEFSNYDANPLSYARNLYLGGELIVNLIIPDGVEKISNYAFVGGLYGTFQSVTLPSSIVDIEPEAFGRKVMTVYNNSDLPITLGGSNYGSIEAANVIVDKNGGVQCNSNFVDAVQIKTEDGFLFEYVDGEYYLIAYLGTERRVVLPESINGNPYHIREMKNVYDVVIPYGITDIGYRAFYGCTTLTSIEIPDSVTTLGSIVFSGCSNLESVRLSKALTELPSNAFFGCSKLTDITIPDGVTSIGPSAFSGCSSLESVELPRTLVRIENNAFYGCSSLTEMTIPEKIQNISSNVFNGCGKLELKIAAENPNFKEIDGVIYDRDVTHIVYIPNSVESICVPKTIVNFSIRDNKTIKHVKFEAGNTHLGGLLDSRSFVGCEQLTTVVLPDGITNIPSRMFHQLRNLTDVVIPESVTSIDTYAFGYCRSLTNIVLPKNLKQLGEGAFNSCQSLTGIVIPEGITSIEANIFGGCFNLTNITIPEGVTNIGSGAFGGCKRLTSVMIPENVTSIGDGAFSDCDALVSVRFLGESTNVSPSMFAFCDLLTDVTLSKNLTSIGDGAFSYCSSLTNLTIPKSVTAIGIMAFAGTGLNSVLVDEDSSDFGVIDGLLYNKRTMEIVYVPSGRKGSLTIPEGITGIQEFAFKGCSAITSIMLPDSIVTIGNKAFDGCTGLGKIIVPNSLMSIGDEAFSSCPALDVVINRSSLVFTLGGEDYGSIALYAKVVVNADGSQQCLNSNYIVSDGFLFRWWGGNQYSLIAYVGEEECVTLPKDVNGQNYQIVGALKGVSSVIIPEGMTRIDFRFDSCEDLTNIIIPDSVTYICPSAFDGTAYYNDSENWEGDALYIGNHLIRVREDVEYFAVRPGTKSVAQDAFENCYKLKHLSIGGDHPYVLRPLVNLETLVITEMPTRIVNYFGSFDVPITLKNIVLADGVVMNGQLISGVTVYVEAEEKDVRWNENFPGWHLNNPVVYGNKWISVDFYDNRGMSAKEIFGTSQVIRVPFTDDYFDGAWRYVFLGYDTDGDGEADVIPATSSRDILACALYQKEYRCVEEGHLLDEPPCGQRSTCAYCGEQFGEARDHELGEWMQMKAPSCLDEGMERRACAKCEYTEERAVNALGHADAAAAVENKVDATCIKDGSFDEVIYCSVCQAELSRESKVIEKLGHAFGGWNQIEAPTCTEKGVECRVCENCHHYEERDLSALGHDEIAHEGKDASCTESGWAAYETCSRCDYTTYLEIPALGHDLIAHAGQSASCTEIGWQDYVTCSRCTYSTYVEIPSLGGHVFGAWTQSVAPAPGTPGEERRICGRCEAVESREVTYLQTFVDAVAKIPTDQCAETTYSAIYSALQIYSDLTASEKAEASETFLALQEAISAYNEKATAANEELKTASEVAFMPMSTYFGFLAALWFLLKRKLM